ncbi:hypothetical protein Srubr_08140 [Streptomyces rubradiris]|uniref:Uncharacterized protein n=1 Tax=Streptomyces rubradiris TaxID=285531 RepID=A0ABQ3R573_STRRR|nr:hypothetical protein GCM10018792_67400 [Streptomyces rubradiris]GHI50968.1 hypothetical protein Srubr_08140 [Streptomyces rubradiris]
MASLTRTIAAARSSAKTIPARPAARGVRSALCSGAFSGMPARLSPSVLWHQRATSGPAAPPGDGRPAERGDRGGPRRLDRLRLRRGAAGSRYRATDIAGSAPGAAAGATPRNPLARPASAP